MTKMMKCFPKVSSLIEKKKEKKNGEGDGFGWVTPHWQLIGSQTYVAPIYTLLATADSPFPLKIIPCSPKFFLTIPCCAFCFISHTGTM